MEFLCQQFALSTHVMGSSRMNSLNYFPELVNIHAVKACANW